MVVAKKDLPPPFLLPSSSMMGIDAQSQLETVSEGSESDSCITLDRKNSEKWSKPRGFGRTATSDLMDRLDEREKEVQALLLAGEAAIQSNTPSGAGLFSITDASPARSDVVDESPLGFEWAVPDFSEVLGVVLRSKEAQVKRAPVEDIASPLKRTRSHAGGFQGISESARELTSIMSGLSGKLAQLSDPQYLDDLLALQPYMSEDSEQSDVGCQKTVLDEVEALRQENRRLQASLAKSEQEKVEMGKVLMIMEDRLNKSNEYLRDAFYSNKANQAKCI